MVLLCLTWWLLEGAGLKEVCGNGLHDHLAKHSSCDAGTAPRLTGWSLTSGSLLDHMMHPGPFHSSLQISCVSIAAV